MKFSSKFLTLGLLSASLFFTSCGDDDSSSDGGLLPNPPVEEMTIAQFAIGNENYSSLVAALTKADLVDAVSDENANLTVFAPDNAAFERFFDALSEGAESPVTLENVDEAVLRQVLLNHVIGAEIKAETVIATSPGYAKNLAEGPEDLAGNTTNLSTFYNVVEGTVFINGTVEVGTPDAFDASNGVIHAVNDVIGLPLLSTFAVADDRVSTLESALIGQDLVATVDGLGTATVFAPLDSAFTAIEPLPTGDALTNVLTYHVIAGVNVVSTDVPGLVGMNTPVTVQGQTLSVAEGPSIRGNANDMDSEFVINDIQATNGVIHVIDRVLLPASEMIQPLQ